MVPLTEMTARFQQAHDTPELRAALLEALPKKLFGPAVAAHIAGVRQAGDCLILAVPEKLWQQELHRHGRRLLARARAVEPRLRRVEIVARDDVDEDPRR